MKLSPETRRHPPHVAQHFNKLHSHSPTNHDSLPRQQNTPQLPQSQSLTPILTVCHSISVSALSMCQLWSSGNISNQADTVLTWVSTSPWAQLPTSPRQHTSILFFYISVPPTIIYNHLSSIHHHIVRLRLNINSVYICSREAECVLL